MIAVDDLQGQARTRRRCGLDVTGHGSRHSAGLILAKTSHQAWVNAVRLMLHPQGMAARILNYSDWRAHTLHLLRAQAEVCLDSGLEALISEITSYPDLTQAGRNPGFDASQRLATPLILSTRFGTVSFLNTLTVFGTPNDVTLAELALEMLFPADKDTVAIAQRMERERGTRVGLMS